MTPILSPEGVQILMSYEKHELIAQVCSLTVQIREERVKHRTEQEIEISNAKHAKWDAESELKIVKSDLTVSDRAVSELEDRIDKTTYTVSMLQELGEIDEKIANMLLKALNDES